MFLKVERLISWVFYQFIDNNPMGAWGIGIKYKRVTEREKSSCRFLFYFTSTLRPSACTAYTLTASLNVMDDGTANLNLFEK